MVSSLLPFLYSESQVHAEETDYDYEKNSIHHEQPGQYPLGNCKGRKGIWEIMPRARGKKENRTFSPVPNVSWIKCAVGISLVKLGLPVTVITSMVQKQLGCRFTCAKQAINTNASAKGRLPLYCKTFCLPLSQLTRKLSADHNISNARSQGYI